MKLKWESFSIACCSAQ